MPPVMSRHCCDCVDQTAKARERNKRIYLSSCQKLLFSSEGKEAEKHMRRVIVMA